MIYLKNILCPTDLSEASAEALRYALALVNTYHARLYLCYCPESPVIAGQRCSAAEDNIRGIFAKLIASHQGQVDLKSIDWEGLLLEGNYTPAEAISRTAAERQVDLIVMRSRRRPHAAALLGSTAESICRIAPCPVLVTHAKEHEWAGLNTGNVGLKRVLVAYDFSDDSERALSFALSLAPKYQAELHLLNILPRPAQDAPEIAWGPESLESVYHNTARRLHNVIAGEARLWCDVRHSVRWGRPYQEVLAYAREENIDLICMGANGKNFGAGTLFGSNVDRVLRQAPCPVLVARPQRPQVIAEQFGVIFGQELTA